jgi:hypothetical protein
MENLDWHPGPQTVVEIAANCVQLRLGVRRG